MYGKRWKMGRKDDPDPIRHKPSASTQAKPTTQRRSERRLLTAAAACKSATASSSYDKGATDKNSPRTECPQRQKRPQKIETLRAESDE
ncbi:hypothetical protein niasHT_004372 [Heterodera trifolii]|uniref:Uncharacterized protein n=1 Tax=Heterodera trifolii TaxID=157864 RepID=A0ABD2LS96_9BILA